MPAQLLVKLASAPSGVPVGSMYFDTTEDAIGVLTSTGWVYGTGGGGGGGTTYTAGDSSIVISGTTIETGTLDEIATLHPPAAAVAMNAKKITGLANGSASSDAAAFGQIPTDVDQLTLAGEAVSSTAPSDTDVLAYSVSAGKWQPTAPSGGGGGGSPAGSSGDVQYNSSGAFAGDSGMVYGPTGVLTLSTGLILPNGVGLGDIWVGDSSGLLTPVPYTPDTLQPGAVGKTASSGIQATVSTAGALTFTNYPTSDPVWFLTSGGSMIRAKLGSSAPTGFTTTGVGVTSGNYMWIGLKVSAPTLPGGSLSGTIIGGTNRSTAAAAAADAQGASAVAGSFLLWDGIVHWDGTSYTLVSGTNATTGQSIAATGRDRRPWALGYHDAQLTLAIGSGPGGAYTTTSTSFVAIDSTNLAQRVECSGAPLRIKFITDAWNPNSTTWRFAFFQNGSEVVDSYFEFNNPGYEIPFNWAYEFTPTAGSHLFVPYWYSSAGAAIYTGPSGSPTQFIIEEVLKQNANNGTA